MDEKKDTIIKKTVVPAINNIVQPVTINIGHTIEGLWQLSFGWIEYLSNMNKAFYQHKFEEYKKQLIETVERTPEEKRVDPDIQTVTLALDASKHCITNDAVREMFVSLIASSANIDTKKYAHPSFPEIIKQLSPLDAEILKLFTHRASYGICEYQLTFHDGGKRTLMNNVFIPDASVPMDSVPDYASSFTLLEHLGLITIKYNVMLSPDNKILPTDEHLKYVQCLYYKKICEKFKDQGHIETINGIAHLTIVGQNLLKVCFPDKNGE